MKTIVTGGAGFLGSHLCNLLLKKGHEVLCIDNLVTGNIRNIEHIKSDKFTYLKHDVTKPIDLSDKINYISHQANPASPIDYPDLPIRTFKVGAIGTYNMLGWPGTYWGNVNPIGPQSMYDKAKQYAEAIMVAYHRFHEVETRIGDLILTACVPRRRGWGTSQYNFQKTTRWGIDILK